MNNVLRDKLKKTRPPKDGGEGVGITPICNPRDPFYRTKFFQI